MANEYLKPESQRCVEAAPFLINSGFVIRISSLDLCPVRWSTTPLGFPLVDQNVFPQLWHWLGDAAKIVICSVWCDHVHETGNSIVLRRVFISPGENHPLGFRSLSPRIWHYNKDEKFWVS